MYRDLEKRRKTDRERQRRYRARKGVTAKGVTHEGVTDVIPKCSSVIPSGDTQIEPLRALYRIQSTNPMQVGYVPERR